MKDKNKIKKKKKTKEEKIDTQTIKPFIAEKFGVRSSAKILME